MCVNFRLTHCDVLVTKRLTIGSRPVCTPELLAQIHPLPRFDAGVVAWRTQNVSLKDILQEKRQAIKERWLGQVLATYSPDTSKFLKTKKDKFGNPVGHALHKAIGGITDGFLDGRPLEELDEWIDAIVRVRAIQVPEASVAVGFVFGLKEAIREALRPEEQEREAAGLRELEGRGDALALRFFDVYARCRNQIYEIRLDELRRHHTDVREQVARRKAKQRGELDLLDNHEA